MSAQAPEHEVETDPAAAPQDTPAVDGVVVEIVDADTLMKNGVRLGIDEIVHRHLVKTEPSGYSYAEGGTGFGFPRLGLTDKERSAFLEGLQPTIKRIFSKDRSVT
jgi:hypothetical protein